MFFIVRDINKNKIIFQSVFSTYGIILLFCGVLRVTFYRTVKISDLAMKKQITQYGAIRSVEELGKLARAHRKNRRLTLETVAGLGNLSTRFLSEFERGKETAEIGKVLKALRTIGLEVIIQPRKGPPLSKRKARTND